jgi:membrane protein YqaA with SNARE-associated domain
MTSEPIRTPRAARAVAVMLAVAGVAMLADQLHTTRHPWPVALLALAATFLGAATAWKTPPPTTDKE